MQNQKTLRRIAEAIARIARSAGRKATRPVLLLWFVMMSPATPTQGKLTILLSLGYLLLPINLLTVKKFSIVGALDEIGAFVTLVQKTKKYVTPEVTAQTEAVLDRWFAPGAEISPRALLFAPGMSSLA